MLAAGGLPLAFPTVSLCEPSLFPTLDALPQPGGARHRGDADRPADGRRGAGRRLRQDRAGAADGRASAPTSRRCSWSPARCWRTPFQGERLSACTDCRRYWARYRAGEVTDETIAEIEGRLATTAGTCGVMGTASTMACLADDPRHHAARCHGSIPAVHADRLRTAEEAGALAVQLIEQPGPPVADHHRATRSRTPCACCWRSAGRPTRWSIWRRSPGGAGSRSTCTRLNALSETTPVLVDLKPTGEGYMEDFHAAGGMPALLWELRDLLHLDRDRPRPACRWPSASARAGLRRPPLSSARATSRSRRSAGWSRCSARSPRAARSSSAAPPRPSLFETEARVHGVRRAGGPGQPHRRPGAGRDADDILVLKNAGLADPGRHAGGGLPADPVRSWRGRA